ncbi:MAG: DUF4384 domain-containing protein [Blastocatellia bacterium]
MLNHKFIAALIGLSLMNIQAWGQQDGIRGGWLKSRSAPAKRSKPRPQPGPLARIDEPGGKMPQPNTALSPRQGALGLGYTLFMVNEAGDLIRVSPDRQFKSGERICLLVEVNRDGYIYIFSQENDESPKLLFPNAAVAGGNNYVRAHQTLWLPEQGEIEFYNRPAREKLVVVFSESKLANLAPSAKPEGEAVEAGLFQDVARETVVRKGGQIGAGTLLTQTESKRGVRLSVKDPAPAFILLNQDAAQTRIVASIQLTHR